MAIPTKSNDEGRDTSCVSSYLLRPLRSYQQALHDRATKPVQAFGQEQARAQTSGTAEIGRAAEQPLRNFRGSSRARLAVSSNKR